MRGQLGRFVLFGCRSSLGRYSYVVDYRNDFVNNSIYVIQSRKYIDLIQLFGYVISYALQYYFYI